MSQSRKDFDTSIGQWQQTSPPRRSMHSVALASPAWTSLAHGNPPLRLKLHIPVNPSHSQTFAQRQALHLMKEV
jgi:hypothetical protein